MAGKSNRKHRLWIFAVAIILVAIMLVFLREKDILDRKRSTKNELLQKEFDMVYGVDSSELTVFLFSSYGCSFCRKFFKDVYPHLKKNYIDKGKVKLVVKTVTHANNEYVINSLKLMACLTKYGNFEKLDELLLAEPNAVYTDEFENVLGELIEKDMFVAECMYGGESERYILENMLDFKRLNCTGTPTFVINNKIYKGFKGYDEFREVIEKELAYFLQ